MDNEKKQTSSTHGDTRQHSTRGGSFEMEKLRRDLAASRRLHEEARQTKEEDATKPRENVTERTKASASRQASTVTTQARESARQRTRTEAPAQISAGTGRKSRRKTKKKAHKPLHKRKGCGCIFFLLLLCVVVVAAFATLWTIRLHNAPTPIEDIPESQRTAVATEREKSNVYLLLAGTDQRSDEASRSDTIMFAALRPVDRKIEMVSIPRDSLVSIPDYGLDKINASLAYGGTELLQDTVENLLNNRIDHTVLLNFESFADIIDAMGGITINVEEDMYLPEEGIDLKAGEQKLNGHDALAFVRWRGDGTGDIGRMQRQSQFMQALSQKVRHITPWAAVKTLYTVSKEVETDLTTLDILKLVWDFIGMDSDALEYQHFTYDTPYINGISYVVLDDQSVSETVQLMKYGTIINESSDDSSYSDYNSYNYEY